MQLALARQGAKEHESRDDDRGENGILNLIVDLALFSLHDVEQPVEVVEIGRVTPDAGHIPADDLDGLVDLVLLTARDENVSTLFDREVK